MKSYKIKITNPCSNKWEEMDAAQQGRFCQQCNKNVIDFTQKSEQQIKDYFIANNYQTTCGRFYNNQIDNIVIELKATILQSNLSYWQKLLVIILVCFGNQLFAVEFKLNQTEIPDSLVLQQIDTTKAKDSLYFQENNDATTKIDSLNSESLFVDISSSIVPNEIKLNIDPTVFVVNTTLGYTTLEEIKNEPFIPNIFIPSNPDEPKPNNLISLSTNFHNNEKKKENDNDNESQNSMVMLAPSSIVVKKTKRKNSNKKPD